MATGGEALEGAGPCGAGGWRDTWAEEPCFELRTVGAAAAASSSSSSSDPDCCARSLYHLVVVVTRNFTRCFTKLCHIIDLPLTATCSSLRIQHRTIGTWPCFCKERAFSSTGGIRVSMASA